MRIFVDDLQPGMKVARDIEQVGRTLLKENAILTEATIEVLKKRKVTLVDVECDPAFVKTDSSGAKAIDNPEHVRRREQLDKLFATVPEDDEQMQRLKYCLARQLQEEYE